MIQAIFLVPRVRLIAYLSNMPKLGKNRGSPDCSLTNTSANSSPTIELLTIADVAELLKISKAGVRRLQHGRHIPFHKVGGSVRFTKSDIMSYLRKNRVESIDSIYVWQYE